jgi:hypothetical protein
MPTTSRSQTATTSTRKPADPGGSSVLSRRPGATPSPLPSLYYAIPDWLLLSRCAVLPYPAAACYEDLRKSLVISLMWALCMKLDD